MVETLELSGGKAGPWVTCLLCWQCCKLLRSLLSQQKEPGHAAWKISRGMNSAELEKEELPDKQKKIKGGGIKIWEN